MPVPGKKKVRPSLPRLAGSAKLAGVEYEFKLAALVALRARAAGLRFELYSNARAVCPFDDVVLRVLAPQPALYLVQLKQSSNKKGVKLKDFAEEKYFSFFHDPLEFSKRQCPKPTEEEKELLQEVRQPHTTLLLCTTGRLQRQEGARALPGRAEDAALEDLFAHRAPDAAPSGLLRLNHTDTEVWDRKQGQPEETSYKQFLSQLVLLGNQGKLVTIDELIVAEVNKAMGYSLPRASAIAREYVQRVKAWAQEDASGGCLSEDLPQLGAAVAAVLRDVALAAACSETLRFDAGHCARLRAALCADGRLRVLVPLAQPGLRAAKALQLLEEQHGDRWTYADEAVLRQYPLEAVAAAASACRVLVLDADGCPEGARELLEQLGGSVQLLQLCSGRGEDWDVLLGPSAHQLEDDWRMAHLTVEAQETLLGRRVKFQGASVKLRDLEGAWASMRADVDAALLGPLERGDATLGAAPPAPDDASLHLPRALQHFATLHASVLKLEDSREHLALEGQLLEDLLDQLRSQGEENDRGSVLPTVGVQEAFDRFCARHSRKNVHWVRAEGAALEWRATRGREAALAPFVRPWSAQCVRRPLCVHEGPAWGVAGRPLLLVGDAGEGKTCALRRAAAEARERAPARWAVYVGLLGHSQLLSSLPQPHEIGWEHALELLAAAAGVAAASEAAARRCLEAALRGGGGVSVYVDGVDEVSPLHKEKVLRLLSFLMEMEINLCVSSRPEGWPRAMGLCAGGSLQRRFCAQVEGPLRRLLRCAAARLRPLCAEEQKSFLCARWGRGAATAQVAERAVAQLAELSVAQLAELSVEGAAHSLLAAPLYLHMAAEAFAELAANDPQRLLDVLQRRALLFLELYSRFMEKKQEVYSKKYELGHIKNHNIYDNFHAVHQNCAMYLLMSAMGDKFGPFRNYLRHNSDVWKEKRGIVWVDEHSHPHFFHFSFAEYFEACWLHENKSSYTAKRVLEYLHHERADSLVLRFLAAMLVKDEDMSLPLHEALLGGDAEGVAGLLEGGAQADAMDGGGRTALHLAAWMGAWRMEKALLLVGCDPTQRDSLLRWTPLQYIHMKDERSIMAAERLLAKDANASKLWSNGDIKNIVCSSSECNCPQVTLWAMRQSQECHCWTVLDGAAKGNSVDVARAVLGAIFKKPDKRNILRRALGAIRRLSDSSAQDDAACVCGALSQGKKETSRSWLQAHPNIFRKTLYTALQHAREEVALILMEYIPSLNVVREWGGLFLHKALHGGCLAVAKQLLREGADVTVRDSNENEPLHCLLSHSFNNDRSDTERTHVLLLLLARGADANSEGKGSDRPLHLAVQSGMMQCVECLINAGVDYTLSDRLGKTPVHYAASEGRVDALRWLISAGADPCARDSEGRLLLHLAGSDEVVHFLLEGREWDCGAMDDRGRTPLHCAAERSDETAVAALLHHGADPNAVDREGQTPLHLAGSEGVVQLLLEHGAGVWARDKEGRLPLHCARGAGVVRLLLGACADPEKRRADANARDHGGRTPLHLAAARGDEEVVRALFDSGSDPAAVDLKGRQPIFHLLKGRLFDSECIVSIAAFLLTEEVNVNAVNRWGQSLLHLAAYKRLYRCVLVLLQKGANAALKDHQGRTAEYLLRVPLHPSLHRDYDAALSALREASGPLRHICPAREHSSDFPAGTTCATPPAVLSRDGAPYSCTLCFPSQSGESTRMAGSHN